MTTIRRTALPAASWTARLLGAAVAALALGPCPVLATTPVIDQQQSTATYGFVPPVYSFGQLFTPSQSTVSGGGFFFKGDGQLVELSVNLWSGVPRIAGDPSAAPGVLLATQTGSASFGPAGGYLDLFFDTPVAVTPGTAYFLQSVCSLCTGSSSILSYATSNGSNAGGAWFATFGGLDYYRVVVSDVTFREYALTSAVPEPSALVLLAMGPTVLAFATGRVA